MGSPAVPEQWPKPLSGTVLASTGPGCGQLLSIGGDLARSEDLAEVEDTVRVRPDDWPVFADTAYARRSDVQDDPDLLALVDPVDRLTLDLDNEPDTAE